MKSSTLASTERNNKQLRLKISMTDGASPDFDDEDEEKWQVLLSSDSELQSLYCTSNSIEKYIFNAIF